MYITFNQFITERKKNKNTKKRINENIMDIMDIDTSVNDINMDVNDMNAQTAEDCTPKDISFDAFKDAYMAKYNDYNAELEEGQQVEPVLSDTQLQMTFDVMNSFATLEKEEVQQEEVEDMDATTLEEGLGSFFKGGTKEEIAEKKLIFDNRIKEIESKYKGSTLLFKEHGDNKTIPYSIDVINKIAAKNNYLGTLSTFNQNDKIIIMYKDGAKGMNKLAAGTKNQTAGV